MALFIGSRKIGNALFAQVYARPSGYEWLTAYTIRLGNFCERYECATLEEALDLAAYDYAEGLRCLIV